MRKLSFLICGLLGFHICCWAEDSSFSPLGTNTNLATELSEDPLGGEPLFGASESMAKTFGLESLTISDSLDYNKVMHDSSIYLTDIQGLGGLSFEGLSEENFYSTPLINGQAGKKKIPWSVGEKSLWENATSLDDIFKKKSDTGDGSTAEEFTSFSLDTNLNLFSENKREGVKAFYLWDEEEPKTKSDSETLPWGWSLEQPNGSQKAKKSSWFD
jgi:hypothetical protein